MKVSVIIVNFNGLKWLKKCLDSITNQSHKNYEVIFVDNNSTDASIAFVEKNYSNVKIIKNSENYGFAKGNNIGYSVSTGKYIILLNNDTYVESDYIEKFVKVFDEFPKCGVAQSKIVLMDNPKKLDSAGSFWTNTTFLYHYGYGQNADDPRYNKSYKIFSAKGASMIIKREVIEKIGLFDDDFWCYYEETDFCHSAWLSGYHCIYYPHVTCYHKVGTTSSIFSPSYILFHNHKNKLSSFAKNFNNFNLAGILLVYTFINILYGLILIMLKLNFSYIFTFLKSIYWFIANIRSVYYKKHIRSVNYTTTNKSVFKDVCKNPRLIYYYFLAFDLSKYHDTN